MNSVWTNAGVIEEEEKNNPMSTSTSLSRLAPELVVMVASHLDVSSYLALASSSNVLLDILTSQVQWKALLQKTKMFTRPGSRPSLRPKSIYDDTLSMEAMHALWDFESQIGRSEEEEASEEVYQLAAFLINLHDPEGKLLLSLLDAICANFPPDSGAEKEVFSVSCLIPHTIHRVSPYGFSMLENVENIVRGTNVEPMQKLVAFEGQGVSTSPWGSFVSRASRQKEKVGKLEISKARTGFDGCRRKSREAWLKLLGTCKSWRIVQLNNIIFDPARENVQEMLEGLAEEAFQGEIGVMFTTERTMSQSKSSQLESVWKVSREWQVVCSTCKRDLERIQADEGWNRMLTFLDNIRSKKHPHFKTCGTALE